MSSEKQKVFSIGSIYLILLRRSDYVRESDSKQNMTMEVSERIKCAESEF